MMTDLEKETSILIADDDLRVRNTLDKLFKDEGFETAAAASGSEALLMFEEKKFDVVLVDLNMPGISGLEVLVRIKRFNPYVIIILITGHATVDSAVKALKEGAYDYIVKPASPEQILVAVKKALNEKMLRSDSTSKSDLPDFSQLPKALIGDSEIFHNILNQIENLAQSESPVLITGENGTGKELIARTIHSLSHRKYFPFAVLNCLALEREICEIKLFGFEENSGGRTKIVHGLFEKADYGTLYLNNLPELPEKSQSLLLEVLVNKSFRRINGNDDIEFNVRIMSSSTIPMEELIASGKFNSELYYHLNVLSLQVPPLRSRLKDIPLLVKYFLKKSSEKTRKPGVQISDEAMKLLLQYHWPGNIRELANALERAVVSSRNNVITTEDLPSAISGSEDRETLENRSLSSLERKHIELILDSNDWNITKSARQLGIDRVTLYHKIEKYNLKKPKRKKIR